MWDVWDIPRPSNVGTFWVVLIKVLTKKTYQAQKGTTLEGPGRFRLGLPRLQAAEYRTQTALEMRVRGWGSIEP